MTRSSKIVTGVLSFIPLLLGLIVLIQVVMLFPQMLSWNQQEPDPFTVFNTMWPVFITGIVAAVIAIGILIYFIIHMLNNKRVETSERIIWILIFLFAGAIGYPIYWYMRIWKTA
jgi:hypothetical protein